LTLLFLFGWMIENIIQYITDIIEKYMSMI